MAEVQVQSQKCRGYVTNLLLWFKHHHARVGTEESQHRVTFLDSVHSMSERRFSDSGMGRSEQRRHLRQGGLTEDRQEESDSLPHLQKPEAATGAPEVAGERMGQSES